MDNTPRDYLYVLTLQAIDFFRELKNELLTGTHLQTVEGDTIILGCFGQHVLNANNQMTAPLTDRVLNLIMTPVTAFIHTIVDDADPDQSVCLTVGMIIDQLIQSRLLALNND